MKEVKLKLSREQLSTLYHFFKRCRYFEPTDYEEALIFVVLAKMSERLGGRLIKADKKKFSITLNTIESLAIIIYLNSELHHIDTTEYWGLLLHNIRNQIHQTFPLKNH